MKKKRTINIADIKVLVYCDNSELEQYKEILSDLYSKNNGILREIFLNKHDTLIVNSNRKNKRNNELLINNVCLEAPSSFTIRLIDQLCYGKEIGVQLKEIFLDDNEKEYKLLKEFLKKGIELNDFTDIIKYINCNKSIDSKKVLREFEIEYFKEKLDNRLKEKSDRITRRLDRICESNYITRIEKSAIINLLNEYSEVGEKIKSKNPKQNNRSFYLNEKISTETIMKLFAEVLNYMTPNGEFLKYFNEALDQNRIIIFDKENETIKNQLKKKYTLENVDYCYAGGVIICPLQHDLFDVVCMAHEFGHLYNATQIKQKETRDVTLSEFPPIFFERMAIIYLNNYKKIDEKSKEVINTFRFNSSAITINTYKKEVKLLEAFLKDGELNTDNIAPLEETISKSLNEKEMFDKNDIEDIIDNVYNDIVYGENMYTLFCAIGYLVGLELSNYLIKENETRKAFDILYNSMSKINNRDCKTEDVIFDLTTKNKTLIKSKNTNCKQM